MREISCSDITAKIRDMCIRAAYYLPDEMKKALNDAAASETDPLGCRVLGDLLKNLDIAEDEMIPICQDTGMAVFFITLGQEVHIEGGSLTDAVNEGVRQGYIEGYLRKSVVEDPIERVNTKDNTPAVIHYDIVPGDCFKITIAPKGFGSENMSRVIMLKPADGYEGVKQAVIDTIISAGANACPPMAVGVGIGGDFEKCALMAKHALASGGSTDSGNKPEYVERMEREIVDTVNRSGIGPAGLGGINTLLSVNIETYPTHIAGLPVAVNICCHANRHITEEL
ncbi:MAG: fumarate hydratase [Lachnospiraceae bacterium]|nr:fumarate hydratase [Lachnospiraceae bacterium]